MHGYFILLRCIYLRISESFQCTSAHLYSMDQTHYRSLAIFRRSWLLISVNSYFNTAIQLSDNVLGWMIKSRHRALKLFETTTCIGLLSHFFEWRRSSKRFNLHYWLAWLHLQNFQLCTDHLHFFFNMTILRLIYLKLTHYFFIDTSWTETHPTVRSKKS